MNFDKDGYVVSIDVEDPLDQLSLRYRLSKKCLCGHDMTDHDEKWPHECPHRECGCGSYLEDKRKAGKS